MCVCECVGVGVCVCSLLKYGVCDVTSDVKTVTTNSYFNIQLSTVNYQRLIVNGQRSAIDGQQCDGQQLTMVTSFVLWW